MWCVILASQGDIEAEIQKSGLHSDPSLRAYYREFRKVVEASDVVLEVLDARDPLGCRCLQVEKAVLSSGANKKLILVLNKMGMTWGNMKRASVLAHFS